MNARALFLLLMLGLVVSSRPAFGEKGLSTGFADVQVFEVPVGAATRLRDVHGPDFILKNVGDIPLLVQIDVLRPAAEELRGGAEPVPDPGWIRIVPSTIEIPARSSVKCDVIMAVPRDKKYQRKTYQAMFWSHSKVAANGGVSMGVGLLSRLRFTTGPREDSK